MVFRRHPALDELLTFRSGAMEATRAEALQAHLAGCARCARDLERLGRVAEALRDPLPAPPPWVVARAQRIARQRPGGAPGRRPFWLAALSFDSRSQPQLAGARGPAPAATHLLYQVGDDEVGLHLLPEAPGERWHVSGEALGAGGQPVRGVAWLVGSDGTVRAAPLDELGAFAFDGVPAGRYDLIVETEEGDLVLPQIEVG